MSCKFIYLSTFLIVFNFTESTKSSIEISEDRIKDHIEVLASDSLEGRETGEIGDYKAAIYISRVMEYFKLKPLGNDNSYLQTFDFIKKIIPGDNNSLTINGEELKINSEFQPLKQSASNTFYFKDIVNVDYGITVDTGNYDDYAGKDVKGKAVLIKRHAPSSDDNPHIDFESHSSFTSKIVNALAHDVAGIFFYTPEDHDDTILTIITGRVTPKDIPIIWLRRKAIERLGLSLAKPEIKSAIGETELIKVIDTTQNVLGYLEGKTDTTVIIGAHFDHLGYGGPQSRYRGNEKKIHYGADDNGSGVAAMLEIASYYSQINQLNYSYLFAAFTGEEIGLLGSSYLVDNLPIDSSKVRMMLNMDMIGRLKDQENGLAVFGTGTCEAFKTYFDNLEFEGIKIATKESGTGPSDHTAFYNSNIPVLHFFTGAHTDYHSPDDIPSKLDYPGIVSVTSLVNTILTYFDSSRTDIVFQRTKDENPGRRRAAYSVTLGVMPDYVSEVKGLKIDGVSEGGPANRAGILKDDVVIKMGELVVDDIYTYMNALAKYRKGDTTTVVVERGSDTLSLEVVF